MPIAFPITVRNLTREEFDERDAVVMRCAYASQNALGRLCDERVYENDLALRLRAEGFTNVHTQVPVTLTHAGFQKEYRLDLLADDALYELKVVSAFMPQHDTQVLSYAMLAAVSHGKLLNFRLARVQGRLRVNAILPDVRRRLVWDETSWHALSPACATLKEHFHSLLMDWGGFLECQAYEEAAIHHCGGESDCVRRVPIARDGVELGSHSLACHGADLCFIVTAFTTDLATQRGHLHRLLNLTGMRAMQWVNLNHGTVQFLTLESGKRMGANESNKLKS